TSCTLESACKACIAASEPRPPQPISPTLIVSPGESSALRLVKTNGAATRAAVDALDARMKSRRDVTEFSCVMCLGRCAALFHQMFFCTTMFDEAMFPRFGHVEKQNGAGAMGGPH